MSQETLKKIICLLKDNNISFKHLKHEAIQKSSLEASKQRGTNLSEGAKALVLKSKKEEFFQVIIPADKKADLKKIKKLLNEKNVALASPEDVKRLTDCVVGSVPPFGILWDIKVFADASLLEKEKLVFSAGTLTDSILIAPQDLLNLNNAMIDSMIKTQR